MDRQRRRAAAIPASAQGRQTHATDLAVTLARRCTGRTVRDLTREIAGQIHDGTLPGSTRLPTIRDFARAAAISPSTVAQVWDSLRQDGLIETRRRGGSVVTAPYARPQPVVAGPGRWSQTDLSVGAGDPGLFPPLDAALLAGLKMSGLPRSAGTHAIQPLIDAAVRTWPFAPEMWTTAGGGVEGNLLAISAAFGDAALVAVEQPTNPRTILSLRALGIRAVGVAWDSEGPELTALHRALEQGATGFIYQPRAHLPLGRHVNARRAQQMGDLLDAYPAVTIVEDDGFGELTRAPLASLGSRFPGRTLFVRSYCKAIGADMRMCILAGAADLVERVRNARSHGTGINSRILQGAMAWLLTESSARARFAEAAATYSRRRKLMTRSLRSHGIALEDGEGPVIWLPVPDEAAALTQLAARGLLLGPGSYCQLPGGPGGHLRLACTRLPEDAAGLDALAGDIAAALVALPDPDYG